MCGTAAALPRPRIISNRSRSNTRQRIVTHMECSWHMRLLCLRSGGLEAILRATGCPRQEVRRRVNRLPRPFGGAARHREAANKPASSGNQHKQPLAAQANHTSARIDAAQAIMNVSSAQAITYRTTVRPSTPDGVVWWRWIRDGSRRRCAGGDAGVALTPLHQTQPNFNDATSGTTRRATVACICYSTLLTTACSTAR